MSSTTATPASMEATQAFAQHVIGLFPGHAVTMLCTPEAGWITGQTIAVDGGASLMNADFPLAIQMG